MLGIVVSTIVFFVASWYFRRYLEEMGIPKSMTRSTLILVAAALISYIVAWLIESLLP